MNLSPFQKLFSLTILLALTFTVIKSQAEELKSIEPHLILANVAHCEPYKSNSKDNVITKVLNSIFYSVDKNGKVTVDSIYSDGDGFGDFKVNPIVTIENNRVQIKAEFVSLDSEKVTVKTQLVADATSKFAGLASNLCETAADIGKYSIQLSYSEKRD